MPFEETTLNQLQTAHPRHISDTPIIGLILGSIFILVFFKSTGTPKFFSILGYFTLFFALAVAITRIRAEVGPPAHDVPWATG